MGFKGVYFSWTCFPDATQVIQDGIGKALQKTKKELRNVTEKKQQRNIPFVTTFNPELFGIINQNRRILEKSKVIKSILVIDNLIIYCVL